MAKWYEYIACSTSLSLRSMILPIIMVALFAFSYSRWLEAWPWPNDIVLVLVGISLCALFYAVKVQLLVKSIKDMVLKHLAKVLSLNVPREDFNYTKAVVEEFKEWSHDVKQGAFTPLWQHPIVSIVLIQILAAVALLLQPSVSI